MTSEPSPRLQRALAELVAGMDGGWAMWDAALSALELAARESREYGEARFLAFPPGELRRLLVRVDSALTRAQLAVDLRCAVMDDGDDTPRDVHEARIETMLLDRARQVIERRA